MTHELNLLLPEMETMWQQTLGWQPTTEQQQKFQRLYQGILQGNQQQNLTRITEPMDFWEKHLWDSLRAIAPLLSSENPPEMAALAIPVHSVIDIGTGAGFPGVPVAIALPNTRVTLMDSTRKKIAFLNTLITDLEIQNAKTYTGRAEEVGHFPNHREAYDLALLRAVGSPSVCAEYALPFVKKGGFAILYRGHWSEEETEALKNAAAKLGGAIASVAAFTTPITNSVRHCIYLQKIARTPAEFPRTVGLPTQQPL